MAKGNLLVTMEVKDQASEKFTDAGEFLLYFRALWCIGHWIGDCDEERGPQIRQFVAAMLNGAGEPLVSEVEKHLKLHKEFTEHGAERLVTVNARVLEGKVKMAYLLLVEKGDQGRS